METPGEIKAATDRWRNALNLLDDARMVGAPPDCVAERARDLAAARIGLIELGIDPDANVPTADSSHPDD